VPTKAEAVKIILKYSKGDKWFNGHAVEIQAVDVNRESTRVSIRSATIAIRKRDNAVIGS
jgi:hypothetical protein